MTEYIQKAMKLFPGVGVRICVLVMIVGVIARLPDQFQSVEDMSSPLFWFVAFNSFVFSWIIAFFSQAVILLILKSHFSGEFLPLSRALAEAWGLFPRILRAWFIPFISIILGGLVFIIPGIYLIFLYYFITHEIIFCDAKAEDAKRRSEIDTEGWKMTLFALGLILSLVPIITMRGLSFYFTGFLTPDATMLPENQLQDMALEIFGIIFNAPFETLIYIAGALIFYENSVTLSAQSEMEPDLTQE